MRASDNGLFRLAARQQASERAVATTDRTYSASDPSDGPSFALSPLSRPGHNARFCLCHEEGGREGAPPFVGIVMEKRNDNKPALCWLAGL